jgi:hypothetical protein
MQIRPSLFVPSGGLMALLSLLRLNELSSINDTTDGREPRGFVHHVEPMI